MAAPLKVALIGAGQIGPRHAQAVMQDPNTTLVCVVDPSPHGATTAAELNTAYFPSVKALLESGSAALPDAAIVCTPNDLHVPLSTALLSAGVHVLCEKPLSVDSASGRMLCDVAAAHGTHLLTAHHRRFNAYVVAAKRILERGEGQGGVGQVTAVSGIWALLKPGAYFEPPLEWHSSAESGGPVMINLIHDIDVLHYLLGSKVTKVAAFQAKKRRGHDAEEGGAIILHFENGVVGTFVLSDAVVSCHSFEMGTGENPAIPHTGKDVYRIFGTEGTLSVPDLKRSFYGEGVDKSWWNQLSEVTETLEDLLSEEERAKVPFEQQVAHLVRVIRGEEKPVCSGEDGLAAVRVAEAVKKALSTGEVVNV
ncbi:oxidoreductase [Roridomyces roridus]|uniref:Oxidoreductase n=1 Tax=Roridomyces roridus TaxID=1738132 RepID=A0AAD7FT59_9AGAR|nr:oxidoreductase [Roridomyces roridus]